MHLYRDGRDDKMMSVAMRELELISNRRDSVV